MSKVIEYLSEKNIPYLVDVELKYQTYFKMGGVCKLLILPVTVEQLELIIQHLNIINQPYKVIGGTCNTIFINESVYNIIVSTKNCRSVTITPDKYAEVSCGYDLQEFTRIALINKATGFEGLEGIPGTIGGAIFMNAGAYGYSISDRLISVKYIDGNNSIVIQSKAELEFQFRSSKFKKNPNLTIVSALFDLTELSSTDEISHKMEKYHIARHSYQEFAYPNLGSMFSTKGDMYAEIFHRSKYQSFLCLILKLIYKNPVSKFIYRKNPSNKIMNDLVLAFHKLQYPISHKSINILINNGAVTSEDILQHIDKMKDLYCASTELENEIVIPKVD